MAFFFDNPCRLLGFGGTSPPPWRRHWLRKAANVKKENFMAMMFTDLKLTFLITEGQKFLTMILIFFLALMQDVDVEFRRGIV